MYPCQLILSTPCDIRQTDAHLRWLSPGAPAAFMIAGGALLEVNLQRPAQSAWFAGNAVLGGGHPPPPTPAGAGVNSPCAVPHGAGTGCRACVHGKCHQLKCLVDWEETNDHGIYNVLTMAKPKFELRLSATGG